MGFNSLKKNSSTLTNLQNLRHFSGRADQFWQLYIEKLGLFFQATHVFLLTAKEEEWSSLLNWPVTSGFSSDFLRNISTSGSHAKRSVSGIHCEVIHGVIFLSGILPLKDHSGAVAVVIRIETESNKQDLLSAQLQLLTDIPQAFFHYASLKERELKNEAAFEVLEIMTILQECNSFSQMVLTLCNDLCNIHNFSNASIGWIEKGYVRLQAISQSENFDRKMEYCQRLENAMEEALDRDEDIVYHANSCNKNYPRHRELARQNGPEAIASIPLRNSGDIVGVVTLELADSEFSGQDILKLRVLGDQLGLLLSGTRSNERPLIRRLSDTTKKKLSYLLGIDNTFPKAIAITCTITLLYMTLGSWSFRVEAPFVLRSENTFFLTAPFDSYIEQSFAKAGDRVEKDQTVITLNSDELRLQEANLIAELNRTLRETEKYRAKNELADMRISQTRHQQSMVRLQQVREYLTKAAIKSAADSVVIEGDISRMLGAPVKKGDVLLKLSPLDQLFVELRLSEDYIHEITEGMTGELSFQSQPNQTFTFSVTQISPAATVSDGSNHFIVKAQIESEKQNWWHPGMTGIAKVDVGERNILWILTHRTTNYLRLLFWI